LTMSGLVIERCDSKMSFKLELDKISSPIIESPIFKSKFEIGISKAGLETFLLLVITHSSLLFELLYFTNLYENKICFSCLQSSFLPQFISIGS
jgi:hypothetical protein